MALIATCEPAEQEEAEGPAEVRPDEACQDVLSRLAELALNEDEASLVTGQQLVTAANSHSVRASVIAALNRQNRHTELRTSTWFWHTS